MWLFVWFIQICWYSPHIKSSDSGRSTPMWFIGVESFVVERCCFEIFCIYYEDIGPTVKSIPFSDVCNIVVKAVIHVKFVSSIALPCSCNLQRMSKYRVTDILSGNSITVLFKYFWFSYYLLFSKTWKLIQICLRAATFTVTKLGQYCFTYCIYVIK